MGRIPGGEKNKKSGSAWSKEELKKIYSLYKELNGTGLHEKNPAIIELAQSIGRTVRSTEAQTLMFRNLDRGGNYSLKNMNKLSKEIWREMEEEKTEVNEPNLFYPENKMDGTEKKGIYPAGLLDWAGHRRGGVKKPFDNTTGRPNGSVIRTKLTAKINDWVKELSHNSPRIILLIGGPGNGKTDALEYLISQIDTEYSTSYYSSIAEQIRDSGNTAPRSIEIKLDSTRFGRQKLKMVQDASTGAKGFTSGECLIRDLKEAMDSDIIYVAGINRGILAEAVSKAGKETEVYNVLNSIIKGLTQYFVPQALWSLQIHNSDRKDFAVWPMDVESLVYPKEKMELTPASQIIKEAVNEDYWDCDGCNAKDYCPFFQNKESLQKEENAAGLLQILSDYELVANNRWSFRELFSLFSYILVGSEHEFKGSQGPCDWVRKEVENLSHQSSKKRVLAAWSLNEHLYHSRLFNKWPSFNSIGRANRKTNREITDILSYSEITKNFFRYFSYTRSSRMSKPDVAKLIDEDFFEHMDPGQLSNENNDFNKLVSSVRKMEGTFSYSVKAGFELVQHVLNPLEKVLFMQLKEIESDLDEKVRFEPSVSSMRIDEVLVLIRSVAIRNFKRIHFTSKGISKDEFFLETYRKLASHSDPDASLLKKAKKLFDDLIQENDGLRITLNSSISQPQLDPEMQITLQVKRVRIKQKYILDEINDVPRNEVKVFLIKFGRESFHIPLTYQLYKALSLLKDGVRPSSLPSAVVAMLDGIKSKLAGQIVREPDFLINSRLKIGNSKDYYRIDEADSEIEMTNQTTF